MCDLYPSIYPQTAINRLSLLIHDIYIISILLYLVVEKNVCACIAIILYLLKIPLISSKLRPHNNLTMSFVQENHLNQGVRKSKYCWIEILC